MTSSLLLGLLPVLLAYPAVAQEERAETPRVLEPVTPAPRVADPLEELVEPGFKVERWRERLRDPDLEARERSFKNLLRRARIEPAARAFLEEASRDTERPDLAWTARLALRELGRAQFPIQSLFGSELLGRDPLGGNRELEALLQEALARGTLPRPPARSRVQVGPKTAFVTDREVELRQGPEGARLMVRETVEGERRERTITGEDLTSLLAAHPELGIRLEVPAGHYWMRLELPDLYRAPLLPQSEYGDTTTTPWERSLPLRTDVLGVHVVPIQPRDGRELKLPKGVGLYIQKTEPGTLAHLLGLAAGHVLIDLDGIPMRTPESISERMNRRGAGDPLTITFVDELGQRQTRRWPQD